MGEKGGLDRKDLNIEHYETKAKLVAGAFVLMSRLSEAGVMNHIRSALESYEATNPEHIR